MTLFAIIFIGFIIRPAGNEFIVAHTENATFTCQYCGSDSNINWLLNGISVLDDREDIKLGYSFEAAVCGVVFIMTITNTTQYNQTNIQCQANLLGGTSDISAPILLSVQGNYNTVHTYLSINITIINHKFYTYRAIGSYFQFDLDEI